MAATDVKDERRRELEAAGITRAYRLERLKAFIEDANPQVAIRALDMALKLAGDYPAEKVDARMTTTIVIESNIDK